MYRDLGQYKSTIETSTQNIAQLMENNIAGIFGKADVFLQSLADEAEQQLAAGGINAKKINTKIHLQSARVPELSGISISNSRGDIINMKNNEQGVLENIANREYFQLARENPSPGLLISKPAFIPSEKKWELNIVRRLNYPDSTFAGVVIGSFSIELITNLIASVDIGPKGTIALRDSVLAEIARFPHPMGLGKGIGKKSTMKEFVEFAQSGKSFATATGPASVDGVTRTYTFRKFSDLPFYLLVGRSTDDYFSEWRKEAMTVIVLTLIFSLTTVIFSRSLLSKWKREQQANAELSTLNQELEWRIFERTAALNMSTDQLQIELTERKHAEAALRESEEQYRLLVETAQEGIIVAQGNKLSFFNPMVPEITGYNTEELLSMEFIELIYPADRNIVEFNHKKRLAGENAAQKYQFRIVRKDQCIRWIEISGAKLTWKGEPATLNFINDITEQKLSEMELRNLNEELELSRNMIEENLFQQNLIVIELTETKEKLELLNSEKDKFFSIIAHDLKSPFLGFLGLTEILAEDATSLSAEQLAKIGANMNRTANNLFTLLQNLLTWAQMQKGALSFMPMELALDELIAENVEIIRKRGEQKGISIINKCLEPIEVIADEKMITSVILNILSNAVKFTRRNGTVQVESKKIENQMIEISISDTGVGMPQKEIDKLFKVGEKIGSTGTDGELSTGLGLLLCNEFIEKNGGSIRLESEEGIGSTFTFTLKMI